MTLAKADSYERLLEVVSRAAWREFDSPPVVAEDGITADRGTCMRVVATFRDAVLMEDEMTDIYYEAAYILNGDNVIFGQPREVEEMYVSKRMAEAGLKFVKADKSTPVEIAPLELAGPIVKKSEAQRIVYAPVLVPGEADSDNEIITAEKIEQVAHGFMESYRNIDLMHTLNNVGFPVESYILPTAMKVEAFGKPMILPVGTWILASKLSEEAWAGVMDGTLTGYSVMGIKKAHLEAAIKSDDGGLDEAAFKRTLLADLGPDWIAAFVSVVDNPAVPKAKFFAMKSKEFSDAEVGEPMVEDSPTFFAKVGKALGITKTPATVEDNAAIAEKAGRRYSDSTYNSLKQCKEALKEVQSKLDTLVQEAEKERKPAPVDDEEDPEGEDPDWEDMSMMRKSKEPNEGSVTDMDEAQLQATIAEAVKSAVEPLVIRLDEIEKASKTEAPELEVVEVVEEVVAEKAAEEEVTPTVEAVEKAEEATPVVEKAEEVAPAVEEPVVEKAEEVAPVVEEPVVEKAEEVAPVVEEISEEAIAAEKAAAEKAAAEAEAEESFKAELVDRLEKLEKRLGRVATSSKSLPNDGSGSSAPEVEDTSGRDAFGRRMHD